jgi:hypothetical protein
LPYITGVSWCDEQLTADGRVLNISRSLQTCFLEQSSKSVLHAVCVALTAADVVRGAESAGGRCSGVDEDSIPLEYDGVLIG